MMNRLYKGTLSQVFIELKEHPFFNKFNTFILIIVCFLNTQTSAQQFITKGDATKISEKCYKITDNATNRAGALWWDSKLDLTKPLELDFIIYLGDKDTGADGIAFVMHNDPKGYDARGEVGGGLYFGDHPSQSGSIKISPSVAIEFDTYRNNNCDNHIGRDPSFDHTTVVYNGNMCTGAQFEPKRIIPNHDNLENNACFSYKIKWNPATKALQLFVHNQLVFTHTDDIVKNVFNNVSSVYYGFTGSTGGAINEQTVCVLNGNTTPVAANDFSNTPFNTPVTINALANDTDADGDALNISQIITSPKNGSASIINNRIRYTPSSSFAGKDSLQYEVCDGSVDKCYANCDRAWVYIDVACPTYVVNFEKISDNNRCDNNGTNNGAARAFVLINGQQVTSNFTFEWSIGNVAKSTPDFTGTTYSGLPEGTYTVRAIHNTNKCISDSKTVTINKVSVAPVVQIESLSELTDCKNPNGRLRAHAIIDGVKVTAGHTFAWYEQSAGLSGDPVSISHEASNLKAEQYVVLVTNTLSGCKSVAQYTVENKAEVATLSAEVTAHVTNCAQPNSGALRASALEGTNKFKFNWYSGTEVNPAQKLSGDNFEISGLPVGYYTVTATSIASSCTSDPITLEIRDNTIKPQITTQIEQLQTSCDPLSPNGSISADATTPGGEPAGGYLYEWFRGPNTVTLIGTGKTMSGLKADTYTVKVTNQTTGCFNTREVILTETHSLPNVTATKVDLTTCAPLNGSVTATTGGNDANYTFTWYRGTTVNSANIIPGTGPTRTGLSNDDYTVTATDNITKCVSSSFTIKVEDKRIIPDVQVTPTPQSACTGPANGRFHAEVLVGGVPANAANYTFSYYVGNTTAGTPVSTVTGTNGQTATGLATGPYTLVVTNNATGCSRQLPISIVDGFKYPSMALSVAQHLTICDPAGYNGAINSVLTFDGVTVPAADLHKYEFTWYAGEDVNAPVVAGKTTLNVSGLNQGFYTVVATNTEVGCKSAPVKIKINDHTVTPDVQVTPTPQSACTGPANGRFHAEVLVGGVPANAANYTFSYYVGNTTAGTPVSTVTGTNGQTATGLATGPYTLVVTNNATGCSRQLPISIVDGFKYPSMALSVAQHLTICDPAGYNGAINSVLTFDGATVPAADLHKYEFTWYAGEDVNAPVLAGKTTLNINGLNQGFYTVVATNTEVGCKSAPVKIKIDDHTVTPDVQVTPTPQSACSGPANGRFHAEVLVGGVPANAANYTFSYYIGNTTAGTPVSTVTGTNGQTANGLATGPYTLVVTNNATGCSRQMPISIVDGFKYPSMALSVAQHLTICDPAGYNGAINSVLTFDGATVPAADLGKYEFTWYAGEDVNAPVLVGKTTLNINGLNQGFYTVVATNTEVGCKSAPVKIKIDDHTVKPDVQVTTTPQTACSLSNGSANAVVRVAGVPQDPLSYTFTWYSGNGTSGTPVASTSGVNHETATGLAAGSYTLLVQNNATGCSKEVPVSIAEDIRYPSVTAVVSQHLTHCEAPLNGRITASVIFRGVAISPADPDYKFTWYDGPNVLSPVISGEESYELAARGATTFTVTATNTVLGCTSSPFTITISNQTVLPNIRITPVPQTSCDTNAPNGQLDADVMVSGVADNASNYTFTWHEGEDTNGTVVSTNKLATNLAAGKYTVVVKHNVTGCSNTRIYTLTEDISIPVLTVNPTDISLFTNCNTPDGAINTNITGGPAPLGYTYTWFKGTSTNPAHEISGQTGSSLNALTPGYYTVIATDAYTGCQSNEVTVNIPEIPDFNVIELITAAQECNNGSNIDNETGKVLISEIEGITLPDPRFSFQWHVGSPVDPNSTYYTDPAISFPGGAFNINATGTNTHHIENIPSGVYSVEITDHNTGCKSVYTYSVPYLDSEDLDLTATTIIHSTTCNDPGNGYLEVELTNYPTLPVQRSIADYTFQWYQGPNIVPGQELRYQDGTLITGNILSSINGNPGDPPGLSAGAYTAIAYQNFGDGCPTPPLTIVIEQQSFKPELTEEENRPNTYCTGYDGYLRISATKSSAADDDSDGYRFEWFADAAMTNHLQTYPAVGNPGLFESFIENVNGGFYTVRVTNLKTNCFEVKTFRILNRPVAPELLTPTVLDQNICSPDGSITITSAHINAPSTDPADYTFAWYRGSVNPANLIAGVDGPVLDVNNYPAIGAGTYYVVATRNSSPAGTGLGCSSDPLEIIIEDISNKPLIALDDNSPNTNCVGSDGALTVSASAAAATDVETAGYSFDWFTGNVASGTPFHQQTAASAPFLSSASGLAAGEYTVRVTNLYTQCFDDRVYRIEDELIKPELLQPDIIHQASCDPSGSITIRTAHIIAPSTDPADYTFAWYRGSVSLANLIAGVDGPVLDVNNYPTIGAGTYHVVATRNTAPAGTGLGCSSDPLEITIEDISNKPLIALDDNSPNTNCVGSDGALTVSASAAAATDVETAGYSFDWFAGNVASGTPFYQQTAASAPFQSTASGLAAGEYTVRVTNLSTQCFDDRVYRIEDELIKPGLLTPTIVHQASCDPSGSITITSAHIVAPSTDPADYTFAWYRGSVDPANLIAGVDGPVLDVNNYPAIGAGTYYVVATRNSSPAGTGLGCSSDPLEIIIEDISNKPLIALDDNSPNTNCVGSDGALTVSASAAAATDVETAGYSFDWFTGNVVSGIPFHHETAASAPFQSTASGLAAGEYTVRVTNLSTQCFDDRVYRIEDELIKPGLLTPTIVHQASCDPSGSITITSAHIVAPSTDPADYTFAWYRGSVDPANLIAGVDGPVLDVNNYPAIGAGTYYVVANRNSSPAGTGLGCSSDPLEIIIEDISNKPLIALDDNSPNTNCVGSDGALTVSASAAAATDVETAGYSFDWFAGNVASGTPFYQQTAASAPFQSTASGLAAGEYTVRVTNLSTQCFDDRVYRIEDSLVIPIISAADFDDQTACDPSGSITINDNQIFPNGVSNYIFTWYRGQENFENGIAIAGITGNELNASNYNLIGADTYFITATKTASPGASCSTTDPFIVTLNNISRKPLLTLNNKAPNTYCSGGFDGSIELTVSQDPDDVVPPTTYSYSFTSNSATTPANSTGGPANLVLSHLAPGDYTVTVTSDATGCQITAEFTINDQPYLPAINNALVVDQSTCSPSGSITITDAHITASDNGVADYTFEWYRGNTDASSLLAGVTGPVLDANTYPAIGADTYFVRATKLGTANGLGLGCTSQFLEREIKDISVPPVLTLRQKSNTNCDPSLFNGTLEVFADQGPASDYTYQWYFGAGPITAASVPVPSTNGGNSEKIINQASGIYTVEVTNIATQCKTTATGIIIDNIKDINLSLSANPVYNCDAPDGSLYVTFINPILEEDQTFTTYSYTWYQGKNTSGTVISTNNKVPDMGLGWYTVVAVDVNDPYCISEPFSIEIEDGRTNPSPVTIIQEAPLTHCDPANPDGHLSVSVNGRIDLHTFTWYEGTQPDPSKIVAHGPDAQKLSATTYTVAARDIITGCTTYQSATVGTAFEVVPAPSPEVVNHLTNCDYGNGALTASVNGNQANYIFNWYNGTRTTGTPSFTGLVFDGLPLGKYTVTATDKTTGCVSAGSTIEILDRRLYPEFTIFTKSSLCQQETGSGSTEFAPEYEIATIVWERGGFSIDETHPDHLASGEYRVIATSLSGCTTIKKAFVGAELNVFNAVTPNGDYLNDKFTIDCIENFPNNEVRIFNRAGALVYEMGRYNNHDLAFEGYGNKGMYLGKKELPDGTYFYIIDKKDGSKPLTGYLELIR